MDEDRDIGCDSNWSVVDIPSHKSDVGKHRSTVVEGISFSFLLGIQPYSIVSQKSNSLHLCVKRNGVSS
jgi:hypothetical protein